MELEEMKIVWAEVSGKIEKQNKLTHQLIMMTIHSQHKNQVSRIRTPEVIGGLLCIAFAVVILLYSDRYQTPFMMASATISFLVLLAIPALSATSLYRIGPLNISERTYKQILTDYAVRRKKFLSLQKINFYLCYILLIAIMPVMAQIIGNKTSPIDSTVWYWYVPVGSLFFIIFARWVYGYYMNTSVRIEALLRELEEG